MTALRACFNKNSLVSDCLVPRNKPLIQRSKKLVEAEMVMQSDEGEQLEGAGGSGDQAAADREGALLPDGQPVQPTHVLAASAVPAGAVRVAKGKGKRPDEHPGGML